MKTELVHVPTCLVGGGEGVTFLSGEAPTALRQMALFLLALKHESC